MGKTHYKKLVDPDFLGAYAIDDEKDLVVTIRALSSEPVTGAGGKHENCPVMRFEEEVKPMIVNATNLRTLRRLFGSPFIEDWLGRKIALYADRAVRFGTEIVEGLRIRPEAPAEDAPACGDCGKPIRDAGRYAAKAIAKSSAARYGKPLCFDCCNARKEAGDAGADR